MKPENAVAGDNVAQLEEGLRLLERLDDATYARPSSETGRGGIGPHIRHILDHYQCLQAGLGAGRVDYDRRERSERVETDRAAASARIREIVRWLDGLVGGAQDAEVLVKMDTGSQDAAAPVWSRSSIARELQFLQSHTVHHYAVIQLMLVREGIATGAEFGVAPSTLKHERGVAPR